MVNGDDRCRNEEVPQIGGEGGIISRKYGDEVILEVRIAHSAKLERWFPGGWNCALMLRSGGEISLLAVMFVMERLDDAIRDWELQ